MDNKVDVVLDAFQNPNVVLILHDAQIVDQNGQVIEDSFLNIVDRNQDCLKIFGRIHI